MKKLLPLLWLFVAQLAFAQNASPWKTTSESQIQRSSANLQRINIPSEYKVFSLDATILQRSLEIAPARFSSEAKTASVIIDFPLADGRFEKFEVQRSTVMHPDLEAKFPQVRSYVGQSLSNPLNKIYFAQTQLGFRGLITGEKTIYIDPYAKGDKENFMVYDRKKLARDPNDDWRCYVDDSKRVEEENEEDLGTLARDIQDGKIRTYRIAITATGEYTIYHGGTVADAIAAQVITVTRVNSVYERDLGVTFQLVANNNQLIYTNPNTDGFDNYSPGDMINKNTDRINSIIGSSAYDIGHIFSTGGGGLAGPDPCAFSSKGDGVTGIVSPEFDPFDIDYVSHEIGHQFGAGHTYYNACFNQKAFDDYEPGSASTILGYAGICTPNVQDNSDAYFHARSIFQMTASILGDACPTIVNTGNNAPSANAGSNYTIPRSTPFVLDGSASSDTDTADVLTYCWEQYNRDGTYTQPPLPTNAGGPVFRSLFPVLEAKRYMPNLEAVINNETPTWEVLPSVARNMTFRLTVRDNNVNGGNTDSDNTTISVSGSAGPFEVSSPNLGSEIWYAGDTQNVTWSVNNTAGLSPNVNILLSTDGGYTYPITLASNVPNDGMQSVTVPNNIGTSNRIKIEAASNIFYDLSNQNFEIKAGTFELIPVADVVSVCQPDNAVYTFDFVPAPGYSDLVTFSVVNLPSGATAMFSPSDASIATTVTLTLSNTASVSVDKYDFLIQGASLSDIETKEVSLNVFGQTIEDANLLQPINGATNQSTSVTFNWQSLSSASEYIIEISEDSKFVTTSETATVVNTNTYTSTSLSAGKLYYWRLKPKNTCLEGAFSKLFSFQTANDVCITYDNEYFENNDNVWDTFSNNAVSARVDVADNITVNDVSFYMRATHSDVGDIKMQFSSPEGRFAEVYNRDCSTGSNFDVTFTDAGSALSCSGTPRLNGNALPSQAFSRFKGENGQGTWVLLATDRESDSQGGTFQEFSVTICGELQIVNDVALDANLGVTVDQASSILIDNSKLNASQTGASNSQLKYVVTALPTNGDLMLNTVTLVVGDTFTQQNINDNEITYSQNGNNALVDSFDFAIEGNNTALLGGNTFNITINPSILKLAPTVFLQGAMFGETGGLMKDELRTDGLLPSTYTDGTVADAGLLAATGPTAIVDWVEVELRDSANNATIVEAKAALLQRNGLVVSADATGDLSFNLVAGDFYVAIKHRNHLPVMTASAVTLGTSTLPLNFTDNSVSTFGTNGQTANGMPASTLGMWAADANADGTVRFIGATSDSAAVKDQVLADAGNLFGSLSYTSVGFYLGDLSLDGDTKFIGAGSDTALVKSNVLSHPGNLFGSLSYTFTVQLPQ